MTDLSDEELLAELGVTVNAPAKSSRTPRQERIIAGFEDVQRFVDVQGRPPQHGEDRDIFERIYAVRLDRLRTLTDALELLRPLDRQGLLAGADPASAQTEPVDDETLLEELGIDPEAATDVTELVHVRSSADKRAAEEIANRSRCGDFDRFQPMFEQVQRDLDAGVRQTRPFERKSEVEQGRFFIVGGQKAYVAEMGELFVNDQNRRDARLRVIFDNGTESNLLMLSLQRALHKDEAGRRITDPSAGPLFGNLAEDADTESGTIYVLRSLSQHPEIAANRDIIHKIGVTGGDVRARIANARHDPTYLLADVDVIAEYRLYNVNRARLENALHRFFSGARLDLKLEDRFGHPVVPREWYLVPLTVIDETVERVRDGSIVHCAYDPATASLVDRR